jgi:hypothetical protein
MAITALATTIQRRYEGWANKHLSIAGRTVMTKLDRKCDPIAPHAGLHSALVATHGHLKINTKIDTSGEAQMTLSRTDTA